MSADQPTADPYAVLGVAQDATAADVNRAYRVLVRRHHPDSRSYLDAAHTVADDTVLREVMAAYRLLGDPRRRAAYDQRTSSQSPPAAAATVRRRTDNVAEAPLFRAGPAYWSPPRGRRKGN